MVAAAGVVASLHRRAKRYRQESKLVQIYRKFIVRAELFPAKGSCQSAGSLESWQRLVFDRWLAIPVLHFLTRKLGIEIGLLTDRQRALECQHLLLVVDLDRAGKEALGALL